MRYLIYRKGILNMKTKEILSYTFVPLKIIFSTDEEYHVKLSDGIENYRKSHKGMGFVRSMEGIIDKSTPSNEIAEKFCKFDIEDIENKEEYNIPGVYLWYIDDKLVYIGQTKNIYDRFHNGYGRISPRNVFYGGQSTNCKMNYVANNCSKKLKIYYMKCKDSERKKIESKLLDYIEKENENGKSIKLYNQSNNKKEYRRDILDL